MAKQRQRRTNVKIFLDKLEALGGGDVRINNQTLRTGLGWDLEKYNSIKDSLLRDGAIEAEAGGPGGAVRLVSADQQINEEYSEDDDRGSRLKSSFHIAMRMQLPKSN